MNDALPNPAQDQPHLTVHADVKILIIEDIDVLSRILKARLLDSGRKAVPPKQVAIRVVRDINAALNLIRRDPPDVILLDIVLGDEDGEEVLSWVRQREMPIRVIVLSGLDEQFNAERLKAIRALNPDVILPKPTDYSLIAAHVFGEVEANR